MGRKPSGNLGGRASRPAAAAWVACLLLSTGISHAQVAGMEATNFKVQLENQDPPNETQIRTLLEGDRAQPQPGGRILLTEASLKRFNTNGAVELAARSPQCIFDSMQRSISSTGSLHVRTTDGRFTLEGEGFLLQQTNSHLIISNRVHTVIIDLPGKPAKP